MRFVVSLRYTLPLAVLLTAVGLSQAQSGRPAMSPADALVRQVRTALGHGQAADARTIASGTAGTSSAREFASALVDEFEGNDASARTRLEALAGSNPTREMTLELALLELRHGQRAEALRRLQPLVSQTVLSTTDDFFLLARAAHAAGDPFLANSAYNRIEGNGRADIYAERGDLFMEGHLPGYAVTEYRKALEADDKWVPAYLGLTRALADEKPADAAEAFEKARTLAPNDPDVWLLAAERALKADDAAAARTALDRVASLRPGTVEEAAWRGAVAYADWQPDGVETAAARVHEINPSSTLGYRIAGEEAARKYRFEDAAEYARKAIAIDAEDAGAQAELGLYLLRTGDEAGARTALEASWARDKSDAITKNLLEMLDQLDTFEVVPDGDIIYKFPKAEAAVLRPYALPLGREAYKTFSARYGFTPKGPILVEVFARHDDFAVRTVGLMGLTGALGACFGRVVSMDSPRARPPGDFSWQATEWHELAHVFTLQLSEYRVPRWLTEGLSVYEEHKRVPAWGRELTIEYARNLARGKTFGIKGMADAFKHPETLSLAYFEASLVAEHLIDLYGESGMRALLRAYAERATDAEAFQKAYGKSLDELHASFQAFVKQKYGALAAALADPPSQVDANDLVGLKARAESATGNFYSQWAYGRALFEAGNLAAARPVLERAAALAPEAQGGVTPHGLLADIAEKDGDLTRARKELRDLLTYDHTNIEAARHLAALAAKSDAPEDQDRALRLVADLDPFDGSVHASLGKRELAKGHREAAVIEFQAALALNPPNLAEAHTDLGEALLAADRRDDARKEALQALQFAPTYPRAQELLLAAAR
jgi:tetratricopeptide (TPR) repeat protein